MRFNRIPFLVIALCAGAISLQSQDLKFGIQGSLSKPQADLGDLVDNQVGFGLGVHAAMDLKNGHSIVPRVDYNFFKGSMDDFFGYKADSTDAHVLYMGADYNYYFSGRHLQGPFAGGGLGISRAWLNATSDAYDTTVSASKSTIYFALAGGYAFNPSMSLEFRYLSANWGKLDWEGDGASFTDRESHTSTSLNVSFMYRF